jgi:hypothetical protein
MREAKKEKEMDKKKARLLSKDMDYQFLEEIIQKVNDNPKLNIKIVLKDQTTLFVNTYKRPESVFTRETYIEEEVR